MTLGFEDLYPAIERNDVPAVVRLVQGASEKERAAVRSKVMAEARKNWDFQGNRAAAAIAALGVAGGAKQATEVLRILSLGDWTQKAVEVLTERKPAWINDLPKALFATESWGNPWRMIRALVRAGLIAKPDAPEYTTLMPHSLARDLVWRRGAGPAGQSIEQQLLEDPALLEDEIFRLFRVEGAAKSLYSADSAVTGKWAKQDAHPEASWSATLVRLARAGHIDLDRLLDQSIAVFMRDMKPTHFGWYVAFHEKLAPTLDEMAARARLYERLLASDSSFGVGVGQGALEKLLRANRLDLASFVTASPPALNRPEKGIVAKQIQLLGAVAKHKPELAPEIAAALEPALTHERVDIQEAARALLARLPGQHAAESNVQKKGGAETSGGRQATVIASAMRVMNGSPFATQIKACVESLESGTPTPGFSIPIGPGALLPPPISDPEEVAVAFTKLVEEADDPVLVERALGGAVRTARIPLDSRKRVSEPLAKRAAEQMGGWPSALKSGDVRAMIASVAHAWATGVRPQFAELKGYLLDFSWKYTSVDRKLSPVTPTGVMAVRCMEAIELIVTGAQVELLSEPTHDRGTLDAATFAERARKTYGSWLGSRPPRYDLELAALRVRRADAGLHIASLPSSVKDRYLKLLGELPDAYGFRIIASRRVAEYGRRTDPIVLAQVRCTGRESMTLRTLTNLEEPVGTYVRFSADGDYSSRYGRAIKTWPLIAPWLPELTNAHLMRPLSRALQPGKHDYGPAAMACLMNRDTPLDALGHVVLAMGCMGAEEDTRTAAADVFAAASRDGRLQPEMMASAWIELHRSNVFQAKRLEATLGRLVADPAAGLRIAQSLQASLGPLIEAGAKDRHVLLRLAASAGSANGVFADDPRVGAIAERDAGSELVAAARALVSVRAHADATPSAANVEILEGLLQRA